MKPLVGSLLIVLFLPIFGVCQAPNNQETHQYIIYKTRSPVNVDGVIDEEVWKNAQSVGDFWYSFPVDDKAVETEYQTVVKMTYDDRYIYISAICYGEGPFVIPSLRRDNNQFWQGDVFSVVFDPVNERTNAVSFGTNPSGVQFETLVGANTGTRGNENSSGFNTAWDNKWITNSKQYLDRWETEMAIPFKSIQYGDKMTWGMNFVRGVSGTNSWHTWAPVPVQLTGVDLGFTGALNWDEKPPKASKNISLIPYTLGSYNENIEEGEAPDYNFRVGADAKIAIKSNLNLDLTLNPDFSQVDVDEQVTNLTTVNIRFPERRLFFLENGDIFSEFGIPPMRPFFSRRIGLDNDGNTIPILYGARLSGNVTKDFRIGIMNLQTRSTEEFHAQNYASLAFNQRIFGRTLIKAYLHNRQAFIDQEFATDDYNRALGIEFDYRSIDGSLRLNGGYGISLSNGVDSDNHLFQGIVAYINRNINFYTNIMVIGDNYIPDMGFMTLINHYDAINETEHRWGYGHNFTRFAYSWYPKMSLINRHAIGFRNVIDYTVRDNNLFIFNFIPNYQIDFSNTSSIEISYQESYRELLYPFAFTDSEPLPAAEYRFRFFGLNYNSDQRKVLAFQAGLEWGSFFNGDRIQYSLNLNYRKQPWGNFGLNFVHNELNFPDPYGETDLTLLGPRIEINFSRNIFWTTFLQYNTQRDNFNINSRFQWQFNPLSNLFIVYSENYAIEQWGSKNRGLVFKLNYWLNI